MARKRHTRSLRRIPPQRERPLAGQIVQLCSLPRRHVGLSEVHLRLSKARRVISELPKSTVAVEAQDAAHAVRHMVVIDVFRIRAFTDRTNATLILDERVNLLCSNSVAMLQVVVTRAP
jgi:hypothetical protein